MSEVEKTTSFLELLQPQGDKANLNELVEARKLLPKHITVGIPACIYPDNKTLDEEALIVLAYVRAKRDAPDITIHEVGERMGNKESDFVSEIIKEVVYFFTTSTREEIAERAEAARVLAEERAERAKERGVGIKVIIAEEAGEPQENPTE